MKQAIATAPRLKLQQARRAKGTQRKVAADLCITETHLRDLELGRSYPGMRLAKRMEHYFGVPLSELFPDLDDPDFYAPTS